MTPSASRAAEAAPTVACEHARRFTIYDTGTPLDPYPTLREIRSGCPVARSEQFGGYWIVTRYADARFVLQNPEIFSSTQNTIPPRKDISVGPPIPLNVDPPHHTDYRKLLEPLMSPKVARAMEPRIREEVRKLVAPIVTAGGTELVEGMAAKLPGLVFLPLLGLDVTELDELLSLHTRLLATTRVAPEDREAATRVREEAEAALHAKVGALLDARSAMPDPPEDIMTALAVADLENAPLGRPEALRTVKLLFAAALDTVKNTLSMAMYYLAQHPEQRAELVADERLIPVAVEEFIRFFSPAPTGRLVMRDVEVGGVTFAAGDMVLVPIVAANHDDARFAEPDRIDFHRRSNPHIGFGAGPHRCLGSHLARMELKVALEEIHRAMPEYHLASDVPPRVHGGAIVGIDRLDLVVGPAGAVAP
ncbi:cytochrome P450 [Pseudonocardia pini]|uniref:cytochrome P450 n=1 Tax=Pseudonocardia pini TaxID=2758030 RepID=UPI0015F0580C|nr:cytochrome P450 [Pseudonocardia pini]